MEKKITLLLIIIFIIIPIKLLSQHKKANYFFRKIEFGTSLTYIPEIIEYRPSYKGKAITWNINSAISISKHLNIGIQSLVILRTNYYKPDWEHYSINGFLIQCNILKINQIDFSMMKFLKQKYIDFLNNNESQLFCEISFNRGDYFSPSFNNPDAEEPYRIESLNYLGGGMGLMIPISKKKHCRIELGFYNYVIINKIPLKSNHTQYIFGFDYVFGKLN